jgi:ABC-2 type transport system permease protein
MLSTIISTEVYKIFNKGRTWIAFSAIAFIICAIQLALWMDGESYIQLATQSFKESFLFQGNLLNGYLTVYIILNGLWVHIPFLIALVIGDLMAGEATTGTFRLLLTKPVSRTTLLLGKFIAALLFVLSMIVTMTCLSIGLGLLLFGPGDLLVLTDVIYIFNQDDALWRIVAAFAFSFFSMAAVASLTFMFSTFSENGITPIVLIMSIIIAFMILSAIDLQLFRTIKPFFFTTYMGAWRSFFSDPIDSGKILRAIFLLTLHIVGALSISLYHFNKKDITT